MCCVWKDWEKLELGIRDGRYGDVMSFYTLSAYSYSIVLEGRNAGRIVTKTGRGLCTSGARVAMGWDRMGYWGWRVNGRDERAMYEYCRMVHWPREGMGGMLGFMMLMTGFWFFLIVLCFCWLLCMRT